MLVAIFLSTGFRWCKLGVFAILVCSGVDYLHTGDVIHCKEKIMVEREHVSRCQQRGGVGVREASRLYNIPFETLRRRVNHVVLLECRPGPPTVLTEDEEHQLATYCIKMADMGFSLSRDDVMHTAFKISCRLLMFHKHQIAFSPFSHTCSPG